MKFCTFEKWCPILRFFATVIFKKMPFWPHFLRWGNGDWCRCSWITVRFQKKSPFWFSEMAKNAPSEIARGVNFCYREWLEGGTTAFVLALVQMFHTFLEGSLQARNVLRRDFKNSCTQTHFLREATVISPRRGHFSKFRKLSKVPFWQGPRCCHFKNSGLEMRICLKSAKITLFLESC